ncbi:hypothetical protein [Methanococcus maripaludis]|uniref:Uncharacterized protein n=1 Tax=Methanococcus maripaludis TaxID=39152 RepID=A0A7J9PLN1_METMI|nr:hypothetical protein [Methanococcus maripaludis]MBA2864001.1 hypothetical protein [Methanococcus maripaludis]
MEPISQAVYPKNPVSAMARMGNKLAPLLTLQNEDVGGRQVIMIGPPGKGKSTLLLRMLLKCHEQGEICIWKGREKDSFHYLPEWEKKVKIYHHEHDEVTINKLSGNASKDISKQLNIETYSNAKELVKKLTNEYINVIYPPIFYKVSKDILMELSTKYDLETQNKKQNLSNQNYFWHDFFTSQVRKDNNLWYSNFFDEWGENIPLSPGGLEYWMVFFFRDKFIDFRKSNMSLYCAVHYLNEINFTIKNKYQTFIYMQDSFVPSGRKVNKDLPFSLNDGQYIIDKGKFGIQQFKKLRTDNSYTIKAKIKNIIPPADLEEIVLDGAVFKEECNLDHISNKKAYFIDHAIEFGATNTLKHLDDLYGKKRPSQYYAIKKELKRLTI